MAEENNDENVVITETTETAKGEKIKLLMDDTQRYFIDEKYFSLPSMKDFYLGNIDDVLMKKIDAALNNVSPEEADAKAAAFYTENPPYKELGLEEMGYKDGIYFLCASIDMDQNLINDGYCDGRSLNINIKNVSGNDEAAEKLRKQLLNTVNNNAILRENADDEGLCFTLEMAGISCPRPPKWAWEYKRNNTEVEFVKRTAKEAAPDENFYFIDYPKRNENESITFFKVCGKWRECTLLDGPDDTVNIKWLMDKGDSEFEGANLAAKKMWDTISQSDDGKVYFMMEENGISASSTSFPTTVGGCSKREDYMDTLWYGCIHPIATATKDNPWAYENAWTEGCLYKTGYNRVHQENTRRFCGEAYIKCNGVFVNVAKRILTDESNQTVTPNKNYEGEHADLFDLDKYDFKARKWADAFHDMAGSLDDRPKIQQEIFGDISDLHKWTVTIGDVTLFVPPTNITCTSVVEKQEVPLLRSRGSATKSGKREFRKLSMDIYFNEARGINGYKYTQTLPGEKQDDSLPMEYHLNGLRALVAQFKFTPFLPIENDYINDALGIRAVLFESIQIGQVKSFPKLYYVTVTMNEFDYGAYMPELDYYMLSCDVDGNFFSHSINWPVMRYYYQRCIRRGQAIADGGYIFNTTDYNNMMLGNRTALIPMEFKSNKIRFYVPKKESLDALLETKLNMMRGSNQKIVDIDNDELKAGKQLAEVYKAIKEGIADEKFATALKQAQNPNGTIDLVLSTTGTDMTGKATVVSGFGEDPYEASRSYDFEYSSMGVTRNLVTRNGSDARGDFDASMKTAFGVLKDKLSGVNSMLGEGNEVVVNDGDYPYSNLTARLVENGNGYDVFYGTTIQVGSEYLSNNECFNDFKADGAYAMGAETKPNDFFKDGKLYIPLKAHFEKDENGKYVCKDGFFFDEESPDIKFLEWCSNIENYKKQQDSLQKRRVDISLGSLDSIIFEEYKIEDAFYIEDFSAVLRNHVSSVNISNLSGTSAQYLGGEDTILSYTIQTTSRDAVALMLALPRYMASIERDYHMILPYSPLRVNSEFSKFLGVMEVVIDDVTVVTSNNQTGVYTIRMDMKSIDRSIRNKEANDKIQIENSGHNRGEDELNLRIKTYWQLRDMLAKAELYPDLELPTIEEMSEAGYDFLKYKFQDARKFVDPDFYFVYPYPLISQLTREYVLNHFSGDEQELKFFDRCGAKATIKPTSFSGYEITETNDITEQEKKMLEELDKLENAGRNDAIKSNLKRAGGLPLAAMGSRENWAISNNITPLFFEKEYQDAHDRYVAEKENIDAEVAKATEEAAAAEKAAKEGQEPNTEASTENKPADTAQESTTASTEEDEKKKQEAKEQKIDEVSAKKYGRYVYDMLADARMCSDMIGKMLKHSKINYEPNKGIDPKTAFLIKKIIKNKSNEQLDCGYLKDMAEEAGFDINAESTQMDESGSSVTNGEYEGSEGGDEGTFMKALMGNIDSAVDEFLDLSDIAIADDGSDKINMSTILGYLNVGDTDKFRSALKNVVKSAACAATGEKEYSGAEENHSWYPNFLFIGTKSGATIQDVRGNQFISKVADVAGARFFSCFGLKLYTPAHLSKITGEKNIKFSEIDDGTKGLTCLDPYYRDKIKEYQTLCVSNIKAATHAFMRNMLYWLKVLIDNEVFPNMMSDVFNEASITQLQALQEMANQNVDVASDAAAANTMEFIRANIHAIDAGKFWTAAVMMTTEGDELLRSYIYNKDYKALNAYTTTCADPKAFLNVANKTPMMIRKMVLSLKGMGEEIKKDINSYHNTNVASEALRNYMHLKYIEAADNPKEFIPHSFHDSIVYDATGRMLKAFPTFYMCFIDEGREIGQWRLHDNFYTTSAVIDMQIIKSRKLPADTANITLSNFYQSLTTNRELLSKTYDDGWTDAIDSIINKERYAENMEKERQAQIPELQLMLRPGARMHIRLGYGSNPEMLPVVFNGSIAEVSAEDTVQIVAQGDGVELTNPIAEDIEATKFDEGVKGFTANNATPKKILQDMMTYHGGLIKGKLVDNQYAEALMDFNPLGIYHFGSRREEFQMVKGLPEITQNIFEGVNTPYCGSLDDPNKMADTITIQVFQKTPWDIVNICRSASPDFVAAVVPFDFRSTLFHGAPRFYYAYSYEKDESGTLFEKRKPFEQYHIYTSTSSIIANGMKASSEKMKTNAMGLYTVNNTFGTQQLHTETVYADIDIYPENQRTMVYDTGLYGKTDMPMSNLLGSLTNADIPVIGRLDKVFGTSERQAGGRTCYWTARSMTINGLVESMKDMYCGDVVILGDPSLKPLDRAYISDTYEGINGAVGVKEVVHSLNVNDGFITTFSPDCVVKANDRYEMVVNNAIKNVGGVKAYMYGSAAYILNCLVSAAAPAVGSFLGNFTMTGMIKGAAKSALEIGKQIPGSEKASKKAVKYTLKNWKKVAKGAKAVANLGKGALALTGWGLVVLAAETVLQYTVFRSLSTALTEEIRNMNVARVYPVEKFMMPYTAGLAGSKGLIMSEHSPKQVAGGIKSAIAGYYDTDKWFVGSILDFITDDEFGKVIDEMKVKNGMIDSSGNPRMSIRGNVIRKSAAIAEAIGGDNNESLMVVPRATSGNDKAVAQRYYQVREPLHWQSNSSLKNMTQISKDSRLKPYIDDEFLMIVHESPTLNNNLNIVTQTIYLPNGEEHYMKTIVTVNDDGTQKISVPMLNPDAITVLYELVRRTRNRLTPYNKGDDNEANDANRDKRLILTSALKIGEEGDPCTGFTFTLQATGALQETFAKIVEDFKAEVQANLEADKEKAKENNTDPLLSDVFVCSINGANFSFVVYPPKVSAIDESDIEALDNKAAAEQAKTEAEEAEKKAKADAQKAATEAKKAEKEKEKQESSQRAKDENVKKAKERAEKAKEKTKNG